jgi:hypothetical protein
MAFMTGFTSVIFGVLVRLRAPLLPFFIMLLTVQPTDEKSTSDVENSEDDLENEQLDYLPPELSSAR